MVTSHGDEAIAVEAMKLGAGDYLVKDVEGRYLALLPAEVERLLAQQRLVEQKRRAEAALQQTLAELELRIRERTAELQRETGLGPVKVVAGCVHDTGAAVAAVPAEAGEDWAYISSGTWSLVGGELPRPLMTALNIGALIVVSIVVLILFNMLRG